MKHVSLDTITQTAADSFAGQPDARRLQLVQGLIKHLHAYAKDVQLTHAEWRAALGFMHRVADISTDTRSEFSLLSDVTGLSSLVDLLACAPGATPGSVLGPFHTVGSPWVENPANLIGANVGPTVLLRGRICDTQGRPLPQATLDFWQNAANGHYWQTDPTQPTDNLRCQMKVAEDGGFEIATIQPMPYQIPTDGPVWLDLVQPSGRGSWRAAHFHLVVSAPGHRTLVTELFEANDPYLETDAVFGVREALIYPIETVTDAKACERHGLPGEQCRVMTVELRLAPLPGAEAP